MSHSVAQHLSVTPEAYDAEIRRYVPGYEAMLEEIAGALARILAPIAAPRVLDLGAGTGALSAHLAARLLSASFTLLDVDPAMLAQAEGRLAAYRGRISLARGSFLDPLPACDAVVASLALHHVRDIAEKRGVYRGIREALSPGGVLLDADAAIPASPVITEGARRRWAAHLVSHGDTEEQAYARFAAWEEEDHYFGIDEELAALKDAGFSAVDVLFRVGPSRVLIAVRG